MAYMLSAQLAAMYLNVAEGKVSASAVVYSGGCVTGTGKAPGFITIAELMSLADASLAAHPVTLSGDAERAYQECLKTTLDKANNSLNFVQATPCPYSF